MQHSLRRLARADSGAQGSWPFNTTAWFENIGGEWINCNEPTFTEPVSEKEPGEFDKKEL